jgi:adenylosuccinate lyase
MMDAVKAGGDRQELHEAIRVHAQAAAANVKQNGGENDFLARLAQDEHFSKLNLDLKAVLDPMRYVGRAPEQTQEYLAECVKPFLVANAAAATHNGEVII